MTSLGARIKALRAERRLQQRQLAEKAGLTPSMVSQIESGRLTPSLPTLGKLAGALGVPIGSLFEPAPNGRLHVSRKREYPVVSFEGTSEQWHILGAGLFPFGVWLIYHPAWQVTAACAFCGAFIIWRHAANIARLRAGTENVLRFGGKK